MSDTAVAEAGVDSQESAPAPRKTTKKETKTCTSTSMSMAEPGHTHECALEEGHYDKDQWADHYCKPCGRHWYQKEGTE